MNENKKIEINYSEYLYLQKRNENLNNIQTKIVKLEEIIHQKDIEIDSLKSKIENNNKKLTINTKYDKIIEPLSPSDNNNNNIQRNYGSPTNYMRQIQSLYDENQSLKSNMKLQKENFLNQLNCKDSKIDNLETELHNTRIKLRGEEEIDNEVEDLKASLLQKEAEIELLCRNKSIPSRKTSNNVIDEVLSIKLPNFNESETAYYYQFYLASKSLRDELRNVKNENEELKLQINQSSKGKKNLKLNIVNNKIISLIYKNDSIEILQKQCNEQIKNIKSLEYKLRSINVYNGSISTYINLNKHNEEIINQLKSEINRIKEYVYQNYNIVIPKHNRNECFSDINSVNDSDISDVK